ncbi:hypothetical protein ACFCW6_25795 [Streptomyces sp. NPDC056333]|uniref:hypothetical protein n=1 Tax=Streptomyces sp. NPDC056333 TaxID=3345786 RepID=UPI0035DEDF18
MFSSYLLSMMRTLAPILVVWLIAQAVQLGVLLDGSLVVSLLTWVFTGAYCLVVHWAELRIGGCFGRLLGFAAPPVYQAQWPMPFG